MIDNIGIVQLKLLIGIGLIVAFSLTYLGRSIQDDIDSYIIKFLGWSLVYWLLIALLVLIHWTLT